MFGLRAWPTPFARPLAPFIAATVITYLGVAKLQDMAVNSTSFASRGF
ncbi:hypothetical protein FFLO_03630 [Filobasidium floriforme]|uniref:Uncharacterized protein n=1 Tax=Filobasidium floriforme TaxID=5210 RepID=A0A8K0NN24_9TREE|nr:hypothetical protein FFLO_03630 [Filobasidium floriforme]